MRAHEIVDYAHYLLTPLWRENRYAALERANYRCALCRSPEDLEVHHTTYERLGDERTTDLVVLCARCHERHHFRLPRAAVTRVTGEDWARVRHRHYAGIDGEQMDLFDLPG